MSRRITYFAALIGVICVFFIIYLFFFAQTRTVRSDVVQGVLIGLGLAFVTAQIYARIKATKVNGWITMFGLGEPGNGMLLRAAHAQLFPGPVNVPQEAMYWWTNVDGAGHTLSGERNYIMHFPAGGLPPCQTPPLASDSRWNSFPIPARRRSWSTPVGPCWSPALRGPARPPCSESGSPG